MTELYSKRILVADDNERDRRQCVEYLENLGHSIAEAKDPESVMMAFDNGGEFDVVLLDLQFPFATEGLDLLIRIKDTSADTDVVLISAYGDIPKAVRAMQLGAYSFVEKTPVFLDQLGVVLRRLFEMQRLKEDRQMLIAALWQRISADRFATATEKGRSLEQLLTKVFESIPGISVVRANATTQTEEIDIVVRNSLTDAFWINQGAIFLIECKNWSSAIGKSEFVVFREKIANRYGRAKLGFLVAIGGFTCKLHEEILRGSKSDILVVPIDTIALERLVNNRSRLHVLREIVEEALLT